MKTSSSRMPPTFRRFVFPGWIETETNSCRRSRSIQTGSCLSIITTPPIQTRWYPPTSVDPDYTAPATDELVVGVERDLMPDFAIGVSYIYRRSSNWIWWDRIWSGVRRPYPGVSTADFVPVTTTFEGQSVTYYELPFRRPSGEVLTNWPDYHHRYQAVELTGRKRLSHRWMLGFGLTLSGQREYYDSESAVFDPTNVEIRSGEQATSGMGRYSMLNARWILKMDGMVELPAGIQLAGKLNGHQGYGFPRSFWTPNRGGAIGRAWVNLQPFGEARYDDFWIVDLRVGKDVRRQGDSPEWDARHLQCIKRRYGSRPRAQAEPCQREYHRRYLVTSHLSVRRTLDVLMNEAMHIENWRVLPERNRIVRGEEQVKLEPRVMQVLVFLAQHADEVVSREQILEEVWAETAVSDEVLTNAIRELRKALGDDAKEPRFIQTIPKRGYRLVAPVRREDETVSPKRRQLHRWWAVASVAMAATALSGWYFYGSLRPLPTPHIEPVTSDVAMELEPDLSPDGEFVVYASNREDRGDRPGWGAFDIYVKLLDGGTPLRLTDRPEDEVSPKWSPDGRKIAFLRELEEESELIVVPALGGAERRLARLSIKRDFGGPIRFFGMDWSPDGRWLAVSDRETPDGPPSIYLLSTETGEKRRLTHPLAGTRARDGEPALSPDGTTVAYIRGFGLEGYEIRLHELGGDERVLHRVEDGVLYDIAWTPDGNEVVFSCERLGRLSMSRISVWGGEPMPLVFGENAGWFSISRNGGRLVYASYLVGNCNIWRVDGPAAFERDPPTNLIQSTRLDWLPVYSPDGSRIAIASRRSGAPNVWICSAEEDVCVPLTRDGGLAARWSPDGERVVFKKSSGDPELSVADVNGGFILPLTSSGDTKLNPLWSRDGNWVFFTSKRAGGWEIWKSPAEGGEPIQITRGGGFGPRESEDGLFIYYMKPLGDYDKVAGSPHHIWKVPVDGGEETPVFDLKEIVTNWNWTYWRGSIVLLDRSDETGDNIYQYHIETGELETLVHLGSGGSYCIGFDVSPDGRWMVFSRREDQSSNLMLVENFG